MRSSPKSGSRCGRNEEILSEQLGVPYDRFSGVYFDKRTKGRATYDYYKGVCLVYCGPISIQRKLISLYNLFCTRVAENRLYGGD